MTITAKSIIGIIIVLLIAGVLWWIGSQSVQAPQRELSGESVPLGSIAGSEADTSDASLDAELSALDLQMDALASDTVVVNQGLNDTPIAQE